MESLKKNCINTFVEKGSPELLSDKLPPVLYYLIVNKIMSKNKQKWMENIYLVHLDLLINSYKLFLNVEIKYGGLNFIYSTPGKENWHLTTFKLHGNVYNHFDDKSKKLYDITIKYLKEKKKYESIIKKLTSNRKKIKIIN